MSRKSLAALRFLVCVDFVFGEWNCTLSLHLFLCMALYLVFLAPVPPLKWQLKLMHSICGRTSTLHVR